MMSYGILRQRISDCRPLAKVQLDSGGYRPGDCSVDPFARSLVIDVAQQHNRVDTGSTSQYPFYFMDWIWGDAQPEKTR
jgi:hypothetical protein